MQNLNDDEDTIDREALSAAHSKTMLLTDLFVGAGHGSHLNLSSAGLAGLTAILWEIGEAIDQTQAALPMPAFMKPLAERMVN